MAGKGPAGLTPQDVLQIRQSIGAAGKIGNYYGVSAETVRRIRRRESWGWLEDQPADSTPDPTESFNRLQELLKDGNANQD